MKRSILEYALPQELLELMAEFGQPSYRAQQVADWVYHRGVDSFGSMSNVPQQLRQQLGEALTLDPGVLLSQVSSPDGAIKFLHQVGPRETIESVLLPYRYGYSLCISSQVGCRQACTFCASGHAGFMRNLSAAEMLGQVLWGVRAVGLPKLRHIVMMGMGEPMDNIEAVLDFLRQVHEPWGFGLSWRHVTVSTSGIVPGIERLAASGMPITLAISLHAARDDLRRQVMPINDRYSVADVVRAGRAYMEATGRRVTYEYILLAGVNDGLQEADRLAGLVGHRAHVNLIPYNPVPDLPYVRPSPAAIAAFQKRLTDRGVVATVRRTLGLGVDGACGQLRRRRQKELEEGGVLGVFGGNGHRVGEDDQRGQLRGDRPARDGLAVRGGGRHGRPAGGRDRLAGGHHRTTASGAGDVPRKTRTAPAAGLPTGPAPHAAGTGRAAGHGHDPHRGRRVRRSADLSPRR